MHYAGARAIKARNEENSTMKRTLLGALSALALVVVAPAYGQGAGAGANGTQSGAGVEISLTPEQRARIKEYVLQRRVAPITVKEHLAVGTKLPADVTLRSMPAEWGPPVTNYRYAYSDNQIYLVEPSTREVVQLIK
jgi:hypothetical protein